jgi:hypothetical protein
VPPGATTLKVTATDGRGRKTDATLNLRARTSCWFAYTSLQAGEGKLQLVDPFSEREITPEHNQAVYDFQFSPDGRQLVYSYGATAGQPRGTHLALIDMVSQSEQEVALDADSIHSFAWSPDSTTLAIAFQAEGATKLGAVRLPDDRARATLASLSSITARVEKDLSWVGNRVVAYQAEVLLDLVGTPLPNPDRLNTAFYAELGNAGFAAEVFTQGRFAPGVTLRATDQGFYMLSGQVPPTTFYRLGGEPAPGRTHADIALLAPSGGYTAVQFEGEPLTLQSARQGAVGAPAGVAREEDTCDLLLAWAEGQERVACVVDVVNPGDGATHHGEVRFFDLPAQGDELSMIPLPGYCEDDTSLVTVASCALRESAKYSYGVELARGTARAFSASGNWFAFTRTTDEHPETDEDQIDDGAAFVYLTKLTAQSAKLTRKLVIPSDGKPNRPTSLSFSRDEKLLLVQRGRMLLLFELEGARSEVLLSEVLEAVGDPDNVDLEPQEGDCVEEFADAPRSYCGNTERAAPVLWAPDSATLVFHTPNAFTVTDVTSLFEVGLAPLVAPDCQQVCSGRFAFQPRLAAP